RSGHEQLAAEEELNALAYALAGLAWTAILVLLVVAWAAIRTSTRIRRLGRWQGTRFLFHQPITVDSVVATTEGNGKIFSIVVRDAPRYSVARCQIVCNSNGKRVMATLGSPFYRMKNWHKLIANRPWPTLESPLNVAVRIGRHRAALLEWLVDPDTVP